MNLYTTNQAWWRFDSYELHDGMIHASDGAELHTYPAWVEPSVVRRRGDPQPSYRELIHIVRDVDREPTPEQVKEILGWCSSYGLFGLLLERFDEIWLPGSDGMSPMEFMFQGYRREAQRWRKIYRPDGPSSCEDLLTWSRYLPSRGPGLPIHEQYPLPNSEQFWRRYAEPMDSFIQRAKELGNIAHVLVQATGHQSAELESHRDSCVQRLNELTSFVQPALSYDVSQGYKIRYAAPSLTSLMALQLQQDLSLPVGRLVHCNICGRLVASNNVNLRYCSNTCRRRKNMRDYRAKRQQAQTF